MNEGQSTNCFEPLDLVLGGFVYHQHGVATDNARVLLSQGIGQSLERRAIKVIEKFSSVP